MARQVLFFASYCGDDNTACSDIRPCPVCLGMSNVYEIPDDTLIKYLRQFSDDGAHARAPKVRKPRKEDEP